MNNAAALALATRRARDLIARQLLNRILIPAARELIRDATERRIALGHNMTGNTINSYAAGVYAFGRLACIETIAGSIPGPLRRKLGRGERYFAGSQRWDGETQEGTFSAPVSTNGTTEPERSIAFLQSFRPSPRGWAIVVCNGVEYATWQESEMNIDVLTANFDSARMFAPSMFSPIPS